MSSPFGPESDRRRAEAMQDLKAEKAQREAAALDSMRATLRRAAEGSLADLQRRYEAGEPNPEGRFSYNTDGVSAEVHERERQLVLDEYNGKHQQVNFFKTTVHGSKWQYPAIGARIRR